MWISVWHSVSLGLYFHVFHRVVMRIQWSNIRQVLRQGPNVANSSWCQFASFLPFPLFWGILIWKFYSIFDVIKWWIWTSVDLWTPGNCMQSWLCFQEILFLEKMSLFVSWDCFNKLPQTEWLKQHKFIATQFWKLEVWNHGVSRTGFFWGLWGRPCFMLLS